MNIHDQVRDHLATLPEQPDTDERGVTLALAEATIAALRDELADHKDGLFRRDGELAGLRLRLRDKTDIILRQDIELSRLRRRLIAQEAVPAPRWWDVPLAVAATVWDALVGEERDHLAGLLFCVLVLLAFVGAFYASPWGR